MSDQSLRKAVEALAADWRSQPHDPDSTGMTVMRHCGAQIARALDEHPAEPAAACPCLQDESGIEVKPGCLEHDPRPAPVQAEITDEQVEVAAQAYWQAGVDSNKGGTSSRRAWMRSALEAAAPLLGPRPLLDRAAVEAVIDEHFDLSGGPGAVIDSHLAIVGLMELARPMPTAEQIRQALAGKPIVRSADKPSDWRGGLSPSEIDDVATIVLALLNGAES